MKQMCGNFAIAAVGLGTFVGALCVDFVTADSAAADSAIRRGLSLAASAGVISGSKGGADAEKDLTSPVAEERTPRFRLQNPGERRVVESGQGISNRGKELTEGDFSWDSLTRSGPASGAGPVIGDRSHKPYFDFRDGIPYPYYVTGSR